MDNLWFGVAGMFIILFVITNIVHTYAYWEICKNTRPDGKDIKDIVQKFHNYQTEWLKSHNDIKLEPQLEEMVVRFLHDTANSYMMEADK